MFAAVGLCAWARNIPFCAMVSLIILKMFSIVILSFQVFSLFVKALAELHRTGSFHRSVSVMHILRRVPALFHSLERNKKLAAKA